MALEISFQLVHLYHQYKQLFKALMSLENHNWIVRYVCAFLAPWNQM